MRFVFLLLFLGAIAATSVLYKQKADDYALALSESRESASHEGKLERISTEIDALLAAGVGVREQLRIAGEAYPPARDKAIDTYRAERARQQTNTAVRQNDTTSETYSAMKGLRDRQTELEKAIVEAAKAHKQFEEKIQGEIASNTQDFESKRSLALQELNVKLLEQQRSKKRFSSAAEERQEKERQDLEAKWKKDEEQVVKANHALQVQVAKSRDDLDELSLQNREEIDGLKAKLEELREAAKVSTAKNAPSVPVPTAQPLPADLEPIVLAHDPALKKLKDDTEAATARLEAQLAQQAESVEALYEQRDREIEAFETQVNEAGELYTQERNQILLYGGLAIAVLGLATLFSFINARNMY